MRKIPTRVRTVRGKVKVSVGGSAVGDIVTDDPLLILRRKATLMAQELVRSKAKAESLAQVLAPLCIAVRASRFKNDRVNMTPELLFELERQAKETNDQLTRALLSVDAWTERTICECGQLRSDEAMKRERAVPPSNKLRRITLEEP